MAKKKIKINKNKYDTNFNNSEFYINNLEYRNNKITSRLKGYHDNDAYINNEENLFSDIQVMDISTTGVSTELDAVITA